LLDKKDDKMLARYLDSIKAIKSKMYLSSNKNLKFIGEYSNGGVQKRMGHLACFSGGMFALTAMYPHADMSKFEIEDYRSMAVEITHTCHESYIRTNTRLGPEAFSFENGAEVNPVDRYYILRPEVVESYFYLWRMTKDKKYRDWAWDMVEALEKHCRTANGYSGIRDVMSNSPSQDDVQQSFFFAETLKYLYLIFSDDSVIPLDKYVFNTEAHPFPIQK
jgi:mannosyl-oligosaccharide alpha-1,2-mannosidase